MILLLVLLSCLLIPYQLAFLHNTSQVNNIFLLGISLVFLVDLALNFFTTFRRAGSEVQDPGELRRQYLRSYFAIDLLANLPIGAVIWMAATIAADKLKMRKLPVVTACS